MIALRIARRYLFARSLPTAVNVLTLVSALGIALGAAALILVLSVFNGFQVLLSSVFAQVDPQVRIEAARGRALTQPDSLVAALAQLPEVAYAVRVAEGRAVLQYRDYQAIVRLRGVDSAYAHATRIQAATFAGAYDLHTQPVDAAGFPRIVVGAGVAQASALNLLDRGTPMQLYSLSDRANLASAPDQALRSRAVFPAGVFQVQQEYDDQWTLVALPVAQDLFDRPGLITAIDLFLADPQQTETLVRQLRATLPSAHYRVLTEAELHPTLYQIYATEKLAGYLIVSLMLLLMASTVAGTLTLIVIDKRADLAVLQTLGASRAQLAGIVTVLGLGIGLLALAVGLTLGVGLSWSQQAWGWLKMSGGESFLVDAFPVQVRVGDVALTAATVLLLTLLACIPPAWRASRDTVMAGLSE